MNYVTGLLYWGCNSCLPCKQTCQLKISIPSTEVSCPCRIVGRRTCPQHCSHYLSATLYKMPNFHWSGKSLGFLLLTLLWEWTLGRGEICPNSLKSHWAGGWASWSDMKINIALYLAQPVHRTVCLWLHRHAQLMSYIWCMAFVRPLKLSIILFFPIYWRRYCKSHRFEIRAIFWLLIFQAPFPKLSWLARKNFDPNHLWLKSEPRRPTAPLKTICKTMTTFLCPLETG